MQKTAYLHAENLWHHDPQNPKDSEKEDLIHCCLVFFDIFLYMEKRKKGD